MKHLVLMILLVGTTSFCTQKNKPTEPLPTYELYSWKEDDGVWAFSLLQTTSRMKTPEEIFADQKTIRGLNNLKQEMSHLVKPSRVVWIKNLVYEGAPVKGTERLSVPPKEMVNRIIEFAAKQHIEVLEPWAD